MTTKTLIIGNSHIAAIKHGWDTIKSDNKGHEVLFFAANSTLFRMMEFNENRVFGIHDESKYMNWQIRFVENLSGRLTVDTKAFDSVVLVGKNTNEIDYLRQFESYSIDELCNREKKPRLSLAAFEAFCRGVANKRIPDEGWQNWSRPNLRLLPVPVPRIDAPLDNEKYSAWARFGKEGVGAPYLAPYREAVARAYADIGIEVISPPASVYASNGMTKAKFGNGVGKLEGTVAEYGNGDFHHMNAEYGAIVLNSILSQ